MHKYEIILYWSNGGQAFVADVPACMSHGEEQEIALRNIEDPMQLRIERAREPGRSLPQPKGERLTLA